MSKAFQFGATLALASALVSAQQASTKPEHCKIAFSIAWKDLAFPSGRPVAGTADDVKWLPKDTAKKYPELCYSPTASDLRLVIQFDGQYTRQETRTEDAPIRGTVTDRDYNQSTISGTVSTTVPYSASVQYSTLSLEGKLPAQDGWSEVTTFGREAPCHTSYAHCTADRDIIRPLFKDALKWIHNAKTCSRWHDPAKCPAVFN